ncbi:hypothetical protein HD554DRAFT_152106 [Boletus coccyginus]|nr:hypothetical protein HD554DRAFT_152106 [Boletus coccyginus]
MVPSTPTRRSRISECSRGLREHNEHNQQLVDKPLDVLIQIFLSLDPLDLLHLARTTKVLRAFLLSRSKSSALWKAAISSVKNFPPCPKDLSAPAYTHLTFVPVCHGCFCPCETIEWELRMRCCPSCFPKMTLPLSVFRDRDGYPDYLDSLPRAHKHYELYDDYSLHITARLRVFYHTLSFSPLEWLKVTQSRKRLRDDAAFLAQQNAYWKSIREHAHLCQEWEYEALKAKAAQLSLVRKQRVQDINGKLEELGGKEITSSRYFFPYQFLRLVPEARKLEPLTPTEWAQISPQVISWARGAKQELFWDHCLDTFDSVRLGIQGEYKRATSLYADPRWIDIIVLPPVRSVLESNINLDTNLEDLKKKFLRALPSVIKKWSSDAVEALKQLARERMCLPPLSKPYCLPSVIFRCKKCARHSPPGYTFDEAITHYHLYSWIRREDKRETDEMTPFDKLLMTSRCDTHGRNIHVLRVDVTASGRVENLIRRMGRHPSKVTYEELRRSTVKVVCGLCSTQDATRLNFENAFEHCLDAHSTSAKTTLWTRASVRDSD